METYKNTKQKAITIPDSLELVSFFFLFFFPFVGRLVPLIISARYLISAALDSFFMCTTTRHDSVGRYLSLFFFFLFLFLSVSKSTRRLDILCVLSVYIVVAYIIQCMSWRTRRIER